MDDDVVVVALVTMVVIATIVAFLSFALGRQYGENYVRKSSEHICLLAADSKDHRTHCWEELKP